MQLFTIPNLITLLNLLCGCLAIVFAFNGDLVWSAYLVGIAAVLDFLDGFVARALKQFSPVGKDLDSLADMVTFGVVPGIVMFQLLRHAFGVHDPGEGLDWGVNKTMHYFDQLSYPLALFAFLIPVFSALRLAKFNNDTRQSDSFIGVPTPANSILICSFPLILHQILGLGSQAPAEGRTVYPPLSALPETGNIHDTFLVMNGGGKGESFLLHMLENPWFLFGVTLVMSYLLIAELPLFSLKFKNFGWKKNEIRYSFLAASLILLVLLKYIALPLVIVLYVLLSVVNNLMKRKKNSSSL